uniref:Uncharacterized protein n=1 Tax=Anguilla anguilla TaxID=7936 RepID=A0A0E9XRT2_ANGAN
MADVDLAWNYFKTTFLALINKHAPLRRFRVSGKDNPWFNETISSSIRERDKAWAKAKRSNDASDWVQYRALRNKCTKLIKNTKSDYYLHLINENLNDPSKFWKLIKSSSGSMTPSTLPDRLK